MSRRSPDFSPIQFGLLGLFLLTFVAAIAAAIFRLPFLLEIRVILIFTLWAIFQVVVMNLSGHGPTRKVRMAVMSAVGSVIQLTPVFASILFNPNKLPIWLTIIFGLSVFGALVLSAAQVIWTVRTALTPESEQA